LRAWYSGRAGAGRGSEFMVGKNCEYIGTPAAKAAQRGIRTGGGKEAGGKAVRQNSSFCSFAKNQFR
jgi:hypothetical protein